MKNIISLVKRTCKKEKKIVIVMIILLFLIRIGYAIYLYEFSYSSQEKIQKMYIKILGLKKEEEKRNVYLVKYQEQKFLFYDSSEKREFYLVGDILEIRGKILIPEKLYNPYEFNYKRYLNSYQMIGIISSKYIKVVGREYGIYEMLEEKKEEISRKIEEKLPIKQAALFQGMLYGKKSKEMEHIKEDFTICGSSHFLSLSGTHLLYLLIILDLFIPNVSKKIKNRIKGGTVCFFLFFVGIQASLLRAVSMYFLKQISHNKYHNLIISMFISIYFHPYIVFQSSFIFSYLSILGILLFHSQIESKLEILCMRGFHLKYYDETYLQMKKRKKFFYHMVLYIVKANAVVLSVQIMTLPFQMYFFGEINLLGYIANIFLSPIIILEILLGFMTLFLIEVPVFSGILISSNYALLYSILAIAKKLTFFQFLNIPVARPDFISILLYYGIVSLFLFQKYRYLLSSILSYSQFYRIKKAFTFLSILYILSIGIKTNFFENYIYFFNVEQGNMALIHHGTKNILIDVGSTRENLASNVLLQFLKAKNISHIDRVILTHMHADHVNGLEEVIKNVSVDKIILSYAEDKVEDEKNEFRRMVQENEVELCFVGRGEEIKYEGITLSFLSPSKENQIIASDKQNANSLVILASIEKKNILFLGDATKETEKDIFENPIFSLQVQEKLKNLEAVQIGHHGSKTSTSAILLNNINFCHAIISSKKKKFGHPDEEVLQRLKKYPIKIHMTEKEGAIKI